MQDQMELQINIYDDDTSSDDFVDEILIPFENTLRVSSTFSPLSTHVGECGRANITVSLRISSNCSTNMYGPSCNETCAGQADPYICIYLRDLQCKLPDCTMCTDEIEGHKCKACARNYYPSNCSTFCQSRNDSQGHFTCDSDTGHITCLTEFTNLASWCTEGMHFKIKF